MSTLERLFKKLYIGNYLDKFCNNHLFNEEYPMEKETEISKVELRNMMTESQIQATKELITRVEKHTKELISI